jgi:hypothetical protein
VSDDGLILLRDFGQIRGWVLSGQTVPPTPQFVAEKCDVNADGICSLADFGIVRAAFLNLDASLIQQGCEAATGSP